MIVSGSFGVEHPFSLIKKQTLNQNQSLAFSEMSNRRLTIHLVTCRLKLNHAILQQVIHYGLSVQEVLRVVWLVFGHTTIDATRLVSIGLVVNDCVFYAVGVGPPCGEISSYVSLRVGLGNVFSPFTGSFLLLPFEHELTVKVFVDGVIYWP